MSDAYPGSDNVHLAPNNTVNMVETNHAFVLSPSRTFSFEDRPLPELKSSRHVRVRIVATGLCGSDVRAAKRSHGFINVDIDTRSITGNTDALADTLSRNPLSWATSPQALSRSAGKMSRISRSVIAWRSSLAWDVTRARRVAVAVTTFAIRCSSPRPLHTMAPYRRTTAYPKNAASSCRNTYRYEKGLWSSH